MICALLSTCIRSGFVINWINRSFQFFSSQTVGVSSSKSISVSVVYVKPTNHFSSSVPRLGYDNEKRFCGNRQKDTTTEPLLVDLTFITGYPGCSVHESIYLTTVTPSSISYLFTEVLKISSPTTHFNILNSAALLSIVMMSKAFSISFGVDTANLHMPSLNHAWSHQGVVTILPNHWCRISCSTVMDPCILSSVCESSDKVTKGTPTKSNFGNIYGIRVNFSTPFNKFGAFPIIYVVYSIYSLRFLSKSDTIKATKYVVKCRTYWISLFLRGMLDNAE
ncbi:hypothetical protein AGLY_006095 [Aphis glycines]|uniref:Uncharacterized protein n=1 Tax=Aphis glycines TaxID=307491 RepID=A0A6G0TTA2_APHGL|nr:hypothetical protein AGLY_006095 [Aphis glycines]